MRLSKNSGSLNPRAFHETKKQRLDLYCARLSVNRKPKITKAGSIAKIKKASISGFQTWSRFWSPSLYPGPAERGHPGHGVALPSDPVHLWRGWEASPGPHRCHQTLHGPLWQRRWRQLPQSHLPLPQVGLYIRHVPSDEAGSENSLPLRIYCNSGSSSVMKDCPSPVSICSFHGYIMFPITHIRWQIICSVKYRNTFFTLMLCDTM